MDNDEEYIIEYYEDEPSGPFCKRCGGDMEWVECYNGCDDGFFDGYETDPLWYSPGELARCSVCEGKSGWWECFHCQDAAAKEESRG